MLPNPISKPPIVAMFRAAQPIFFEKGKVNFQLVPGAKKGLALIG
jgi:hypothetical protein